MVQGVPASFPGTRAGTEAGDLPGERNYLTVAEQTIKHPGATVSVGTIYSNIVTVPNRGMKFTAKQVKGATDATAVVNVKVDGDKILSSNQKIASPGATLVVTPSQYQQHAQKNMHTVEFIVQKIKASATKKGTVVVTPEVQTLHS